MSTPAVSGTLALMQEFYANAYGARPSPAMLKAMLINGARATGFYNFQAQNTINYEGWGLINLPDSLPPGITNQLGHEPVPLSFRTRIRPMRWPPATARPGWSHTTNALPLHVTLAWTDPPGDPAAAIKLVNNLVLVVTNLSNPTNPIVYYGNDIPAASTVNSPHATNTPPVFDSINNVQNVNLPLGAGTNFSVTVMGYRVNVNAVTAQTNNVVQDYALVISCGNGQVTNVMTVSPPRSGGFQSHRRPASHRHHPNGGGDYGQLSIAAEPVCGREHAVAGHQHAVVHAQRSGRVRAEQLAGDRRPDQPVAFLRDHQYVWVFQRGIRHVQPQCA